MKILICCLKAIVNNDIFETSIVRSKNWGPVVALRSVGLAISKSSFLPKKISFSSNMLQYISYVVFLFLQRSIATVLFA